MWNQGGGSQNTRAVKYERVLHITIWWIGGARRPAQRRFRGGAECISCVFLLGGKWFDATTV
jgi:hypothetical protein